MVDACGCPAFSASPALTCRVVPACWPTPVRHGDGRLRDGVVTAVTVQNTRGVAGVHAVPVDTVIAQLDAVADDVQIDAVKIGMLGEASLAEAVGARLSVVVALLTSSWTPSWSRPPAGVSRARTPRPCCATFGTARRPRHP